MIRLQDQIQIMEALDLIMSKIMGVGPTMLWGVTI